ncbi:glycerate kinase [Natronospora cellulosivora (SeqCode)]
MKIVIAPDTFKGSVDSIDVATHMENGVLKVFPSAEIVKIPISDGGEGLVHSLLRMIGGCIIDKEVVGPLGETVSSYFALLDDEETAVVEMAAASGLPLVPLGKANPLKATTYGTGELIKAALDKNVTKIILGIGGSATNDAGVGMMQALGASFLDERGKEVSFGGENLEKIKRIELNKVDSRINDVSIKVACDVNNPLYGQNGAAYVYGPQKGATDEMLEMLDRNLQEFARLVKECQGIDLQKVPGSGAAGGIGASLYAFLGADLMPGIDIVFSLFDIEESFKNADLVLTAEGKIDKQSLNGKVPIGVAKKAKEFNVPVIALAGIVEEDSCELLNEEIDAIFSISQRPTRIDQAFEMSSKWIELSTEQIMRVFKIKERS